MHSCMILSWNREKCPYPIRFAGTWKTYSKKAIPQLARIASGRADFVFLRWPYHAIVIKIFEIVSKAMVAISLRFLVRLSSQSGSERIMRSSVACSERPAGLKSGCLQGRPRRQPSSRELGAVNNEVLLAAKCNPLDQAMSTKAQNDWQAPSNAYVAAMYPETNGRAWYGSTLPTEKD